MGIGSFSAGDLNGIGAFKLDQNELDKLQLPGVMDAEAAPVSNKDKSYMLMGNTPEERAGEAAGRFNAENYYGPSSQIGEDSRSFTNMLKGKLTEGSADAQKYLTTQNRKSGLADAKAQFSGVNNMASSEQNRRNTMFQADAQNRNYQNEMMDKNKADIGRRVSGTETLAASGLGRSIASTPIQQASNSGTMPCLALLGLGLMSKETYASESGFINKESLEYIGYAILTAPLIPILYRNMSVAKIYSYFAHKYIGQLTGKNKNTIGKIIISIGKPVCKTVGWING